MDTRSAGIMRRVIASLLLAGGLGGCVLAPPYAYDATYPGYGGYPGYAAPPVALDLGFSFYDGPRHGYRGDRHHGWGDGGGWSGRGGGPGHHGGWRGGRGRH